MHNRYSCGLKQYKKLDFEIPSHLKTAMEESQVEFNNFKLKFSTKSFEFKEFGKDFVKDSKMSPDAFFQMAMQLVRFDPMTLG